MHREQYVRKAKRKVRKVNIPAVLAGGGEDAGHASMRKMRAKRRERGS